jgi:hypothetical protein
VCTENSVRIDYVTESHNVSGDALEKNRKREGILGLNSSYRSAEVCARSPVFIGDFCGLGSQRRMLNADGLAEGERLYSNILLQNFARLRSGSLREGLNPPSGLTEGHLAGIWVRFPSIPDMRPLLAPLVRGASSPTTTGSQSPSSGPPIQTKSSPPPIVGIKCWIQSTR